MMLLLAAPVHGRCLTAPLRRGMPRAGPSRSQARRRRLWPARASPQSGSGSGSVQTARKELATLEQEQAAAAAEGGCDTEGASRSLWDAGRQARLPCAGHCRAEEAARLMGSVQGLQAQAAALVRAGDEGTARARLEVCTQGTPMHAKPATGSYRTALAGEGHRARGSCEGPGAGEHQLQAGGAPGQPRWCACEARPRMHPQQAALRSALQCSQEARPADWPPGEGQARGWQRCGCGRQPADRLHQPGAARSTAPQPG